MISSKPRKFVAELRHHVDLFLQSRRAMHVTHSTLKGYQNKLKIFLSRIDATPGVLFREDIESFLLQFKNPGNRHSYYRVLKTFFSWRQDSFNISNPMDKISPPKVPKKEMPRLHREQVFKLIEICTKVRDKAIIALFVESGLRLSELANIRLADIDWSTRLISVWVKGQKQSLATYGSMTEKLLKAWITEYEPGDGSIWGLTPWGIESMLQRLKKRSGLPCNPHTFRRTFACLLRESGADILNIKDLGRWETTTMVAHYTRSMKFKDSLKFYNAPLSEC